MTLNEEKIGGGISICLRWEAVWREHERQELLCAKVIGVNG